MNPHEPIAATAGCAAVIERYGRARSARDVDAVSAVLHDEFVYEDPQLPSGLTNRSGYLHLLGKLWQQCTQLSIEPSGELYLRAADTAHAVQRWVCHGTLDVPTDGDTITRVAFELVEFYEVEDERIARISIFQRSLI